MPSHYLLGSALFSGLFIWASLSIWIQLNFKVRRSDIAALKLALKARNVKVAGIPEAALVEIILSLGNTFRLTDVGADLTGSLDTQAAIIQQIIQDGPRRYKAMPANGILLKYGVVEPDVVPAMSVDQFSRAVRHESIYLELAERRALRA